MQSNAQKSAAMDAIANRIALWDTEELSRRVLNKNDWCLATKNSGKAFRYSDGFILESWVISWWALNSVRIWGCKLIAETVLEIIDIKSNPIKHHSITSLSSRTALKNCP